MKNITTNFKLVVLALGFLWLTSCSDLLDDTETDFGNTPVLVQFQNNEVTANFITTDANPKYTYEIPVTLIGGRNQPISEDVNLKVSVDPTSTATVGKEYNIVGGNQITIKKGSMVANVTIEVLSENLDPEDPKKLILAIDSSSKTVSESSKTTVQLQAACELDMSTFYGTYNSAQVTSAGTIINNIVKVSEGPEPRTLIITGLYVDDSSSRTIVELGEDPTNPIVKFRSEELDAVLYISGTYGDVWASTLTPESSSYKSCSGELNLSYKRCVSIGCFGGSNSAVLTKQ